MLSKEDSRKKAVGTSGNGKFLNDLETLSKAFYVDKKMSRLASSTASSRSKSVGKFHVPEAKKKPEDANNYTKASVDKDKKSSIWSWKGLKSLTHVKNQADGEQTTPPIRVCQGVAEFEKQLTHSCSVYGSRSGPHHSAKYEAKHFLLYVSVYDAPELDLGKHRIDLTRLLPLKLEELEEDKSSGSGQLVLNYQQNSEKTVKMVGPSDQMDDISIHRAGSLPSRLYASYQSVEDVKDLHEVLPMPRSELCDSVNILYQKLDEEISNTSAENKLEADILSSPDDPHKVELLAPPDAGEKNCGTECEMTEFSVVDKGIEEFTEENAKPEDESSENAQEAVPQNDEQSKTTSSYKEQETEMCSKESLMKELEAALSCTSDLVNEELDSQEDETDVIAPESHLDVNSNYKDLQKGKSLSLDDDTESVARDFLEMLGIEHSPFSLSSESEPSLQESIYSGSLRRTLLPMEVY
ncbi:hypothetical protein DH2020_026619 [Rehmannia glutinosa]|uniref:C2 NT-type domain-containing protein n=1 Tax=Rehmannia glutinosa TaxID=99300 RepID=A0ABR0VZF0_REHGL